MKGLFVFSLLCSLLLGACQKNHSEQVLESMQAVEMAMRQNVDNPEGLFAALDACIGQYGPLWEKSARLLENTSEASYIRSHNIQSESLRKVQLSIINLDLEIQDNLKDRPELLQKYYQKLDRLGAQSTGNGDF